MNYEPFEFKNAFLDDERSLKFDPSRYEYYRQLLASYYWMDCWFDNQSWTIPTQKIGTCAMYKCYADPDDGYKYPAEDLKDHDYEFKEFFPRLNSVSPKDVGEILKFDDVDKAFDLIEKSDRCRSTIDMAQKIGRPIYIYARKWIDMSDGWEFRVFIYDMKIVAISSASERICELDKTEIIARCQSLLNACKWDLPFPDVCMDVWLDSQKKKKDLIIEFNSYGSWGNASAELFDWKEDQAQLMGAISEIEVRTF
jgi:hypothetical protein